MAVGNDSTVFFPNNRGPQSPTRGYGKTKPKNVGSPQNRTKLQLDLNQEQSIKSKQVQQSGRNRNNKGRHSPSKPSSPRASSSPISINVPQGSNASLYAGFTESPPPDSLPKPPSHWVIPDSMSTGLGPSEMSLERLPHSVRTFLDVRA